MTSSFKPYPIYDMKSGIKLDQEPWLLPQDAFVNLQNCFLFEGKIKKRRGYDLLWRMVHGIEDEVIGTGDTSEVTFSGTLASYPLRPGDLEITDTVETFTDDGLGVLAGDGGGSGTIDYDTGEFSVTFNSPPGMSQDITANYDFYPGLPVMGIWNYITESGTEQLLVFNTRRMNFLDDVNNKLEDPTKSDVFTGEDYHFFWLTNWLNSAYISNGIDRVKTWDGLTLSDLLVDVDGDTVNDVTYALYCFAYKSRIVLLRTEEGGFGQFQRARWSLVGTADFSGDEFVDAPVNDWIICAGFLRDELIVWFERSIWALRYTGSERLPFRWVRLVSQEGSLSPLSLIEFADEQLAFGSVSVVGFDGRDSYNIADKLSNFILGMNQNALEYSYSGVSEEYRQAWFTYASMSSDLPDKLLVLNYDDNSWAIFDMPMHCLGYYAETTSPTWDDIETPWDEMDRIWDERDFQAGFPRMIGGDYNGYIYRMERAGSDNGADIYAEVLTSVLNPYLKQGIAARLGWVDLLVDRSPLIELQVDFFINEEDTAVISQTINFGGDSGRETGKKAWIRAYCGAEGESHQLKISHTASNQAFVIHAIVPYFKAAGRLR